MRAEEPAPSRRDDRAADLRAAIEASDHAPGQDPSFSPDGGVTVYDAFGRAARVQPLGQRTRISITAEDGRDAEGEVDTDTLVTAIGRHRSAYGALAAALDQENAQGSPVD